MSRITPALERLVTELAKLPSVGPKTALRQALYLLETDVARVEELVAVVQEARRKIRRCGICFNYTEGETCDICADPRRERGVICVISEIADLYAIERSGEYRGLYHVLWGQIAPLEGKGPSDIKLAELLERLRCDEVVREVIIATNPNVEGDATAMFIRERIRGLTNPPRVSRIAYGLPVGGELDYADGLTLARALASRNEL